MSRISDIKQQISRVDIVTVLNSLGYEISRTWQFKLRSDEKTPSTSIRKDGYMNDFGSDWSGDIFNLLQQYHNMSLSEAEKYVTVQLGITLQKGDHSYTKKEIKPISNKVSRSITSHQLQREWDNFDEITFKKHKGYLLEICPAWVYKTASRSSIDKFKENVKYDPINDSIVIRMEDDGVIYSYKHRTKKGKNGKWFARFNTKANSRCLMNITNNRPGSSIYVLEGVHDYATALLLGLNCMVVPYAGYREFSQKELLVLNDKEVKFMPDMDKSGIESARRLASQIESGEVVIFDLKRLPFAYGDKLDFTDVAEAFNNLDKEYFLGCLEYYSDIPIYSGNGMEIF